MDKVETRTYGQHLLLDCYQANPAKLFDLGLIFGFLDKLPGLIGMQKIGPPQMAKFDDPEIAGITGIVMIVTSHISIHTYALKGCFFLDVFSCKEFEPALVIERACSVFEAKDYVKKFTVRGSKFPVGNLYRVKGSDNGNRPH